MIAKGPSVRGFSKPLAMIAVLVVVIFVALIIFGGALRHIVRESLMQRVTAAHYEILCPPGGLSHDAMNDFAKQRETLFAALNKKLGDADSNTEIRIVFDPDFSAPTASEAAELPYAITGTTVRAKLIGQRPALPASADAEAMLDAAWGKPGNANLARWTAIWLLGEWRGAEIGMAAAQVEQRLGHKKVEIVLGGPAAQISSLDDRTLLGAAWISEVAELGGATSVRKLYSAKMPELTVAEVSKVLGTTPLELDRRWQMWMYAYLAGMPSTPQSAGMPMDMPMPGNR
jgi:hypothetical protein